MSELATENVGLRLVRSVAADDTALLIAPDNTGAGEVSVAQALAAEAAFAVKLRDGLIVLDVDIDKDASWLPPTLDSLHRAYARTVMEVASGREGHRHIYLLGAVGWSSADLAELASSAGAPADALRWGNGNRIRPPQSRHRSGRGRARLVNPEHPHEALARLERRPLTVALDSKWIAGLTGVDLAALPTTRDGSVDRDKALVSVALAYVNAGLDISAYISDCLASPWASAKLAERGQPAGGQLQAKWEAARRFARTHPPTGAPERGRRLELIASAHAAHPWRGRAGVTDETVLARLLEVAHAHATLDPTHSQRTLAEECGVSASTISASLARLEEAGWISRTARGRGESHRLQLLLPKARVQSVGAGTTLRGPHLSSTCSDSSTLAREVPDAWRGRGGLPRASFETWLAMRDGGWLSAAEVAQRRPGALQRSTIRSHLTALHSAGLVDRSGPQGHRWSFVERSDSDLTRLASRLGTAGARAAQQELHARQREYDRHWSGRRTRPAVTAASGRSVRELAA